MRCWLVSEEVSDNEERAGILDMTILCICNQKHRQSIVEIHFFSSYTHSDPRFIFSMTVTRILVVRALEIKNEDILSLHSCIIFLRRNDYLHSSRVCPIESSTYQEHLGACTRFTGLVEKAMSLR